MTIATHSVTTVYPSETDAVAQAAILTSIMNTEEAAAALGGMDGLNRQSFTLSYDYAAKEFRVVTIWQREQG